MKSVNCYRHPSCKGVTINYRDAEIKSFSPDSSGWKALYAGWNEKDGKPYVEDRKVVGWAVYHRTYQDAKGVDHSEDSVVPMVYDPIFPAELKPVNYSGVVMGNIYKFVSLIPPGFTEAQYLQAVGEAKRWITALNKMES